MDLGLSGPRNRIELTVVAGQSHLVGGSGLVLERKRPVSLSGAVHRAPRSRCSPPSGRCGSPDRRARRSGGAQDTAHQTCASEESGPAHPQRADRPSTPGDEQVMRPDLDGRTKPVRCRNQEASQSRNPEVPGCQARLRIAGQPGGFRARITALSSLAENAAWPVSLSGRILASRRLRLAPLTAGQTPSARGGGGVWGGVDPLR